MESTLKQRLIGAAVLIALAVIFVPMLLDGSGQKESVALNIEVPPQPEFTFESELPDPKELDNLPSIKTSNKEGSKVNVPKTASSTNSSTTSENSSEKTVVEATANLIKTKPSLGAWAVQVAAFGEKEKALALQQKLLDGNFPAFTEKSTGKKNIVYRVKVGPEIKRENAEKLRDKIIKELNLQGSFVTNHP